jgi:hypothetical protein
VVPGQQKRNEGTAAPSKRSSEKADAAKPPSLFRSKDEAETSIQLGTLNNPLDPHPRDSSG